MCRAIFKSGEFITKTPTSSCPKLDPKYLKIVSSQVGPENRPKFSAQNPLFLGPDQYTGLIMIGSKIRSLTMGIFSISLSFLSSLLLYFSQNSKTLSRTDTLHYTTTVLLPVSLLQNLNFCSPNAGNILVLCYLLTLIYPISSFSCYDSFWWDDSPTF